MGELLENVFSLDGLNLVIWAVYIGYLLASIFYYYQKKVIGGFVRALFAQNAHTPETALSLAELGYHKHPAIRRQLSQPGALRKMVWEVEDKYLTGEDGVLYSAREKALDINVARFYISEERRIQAELRYDNKGNDLLALIMGAALCFVLAVAAIIWLPGILVAATQLF